MRPVAEVVQQLPRRWWFCPADGLGDRDGIDGGTYWAYPLNRQPPVDAVADARLSWLAEQPPVTEWALDTSDADPRRRLATRELRAVLTGSAAPSAVSVLADRPELQRRLRSFTGCYFDLGDRLAEADGGVRLMHLISDQQWVRHWLVIVGEPSAPVVSTQLPLGFELSEDEAESGSGEMAIPPVVPLDGSIDLDVAADSVEEFLYRFWIENEIAFRVAAGDPLTEPFAGYVEGLRAGG